MTTSYQLIQSSEYISDTAFLKTDYAFKSNATSYYFDQAIITRQWGLVCDLSYTPFGHVHDEHIYWQPLLAGRKDTSLMPNQSEFESEIAQREEWLSKESRSKINENCLDTSSHKGATIYLMHCFMWYPYGHFFDCIQRIFHIPDDIHIPSSRFLICESTSRVSSFMDHLNTFGVNADQLQVVPRGYESIRVSNLIVPDSVAEPSQYTNESITRIRNLYLSSNLLKSMEKCLTLRSLFDKKLALILDRSSTGSRYIANQDQIVSVLEKMNYFCIVLTGSEPFGLMLFLFSRADLVFSPHGSMMVNTIFCPEQCKIIEAIPKERLTLHFLRQCKPASHSAFIIDSGESQIMTFNPNWLEELI